MHQNSWISTICDTSIMHKKLALETWIFNIFFLFLTFGQHIMLSNFDSGQLDTHKFDLRWNSCHFCREALDRLKVFWWENNGCFVDKNLELKCWRFSIDFGRHFVKQTHWTLRQNSEPRFRHWKSWYSCHRVRNVEKVCLEPWRLPFLFWKKNFVKSKQTKFHVKIWLTQSSSRV